jgi:hypothetical protein
MKNLVHTFAGGLLLAAVASGQYSTHFEGVNASTAGVDLNGQAGFYLPAVAMSLSLKAFLYPSNALGIPTNPTGAAKFVALTGPGGGTYGRSERKVAWCGDKWTVGVDVCADYQSTAVATNNIGSFSLQPSTTARYFNCLLTWTVGQEGKLWNCSFQYSDSTAATLTAIIPDTNFQNLALKKWYRWEVDFDMKTNVISEIRLKDIATNTTFKHQPTGWYLVGGPNNTKPLPDAIRMFAGGGGAGNVLAFDNINVTLREGGTKAVATVYGSGASRPNPSGSMVVSGLPIIDTTVSLGAHNPVATQKAGSVPVFFFAAKKLDPGPQIPGLGMASKGAKGELLVDLFLFTALGPAWDGNNPAAIGLPIPALCPIVGLTLYSQALMIDPTPSAPVPFGLTEAAELKIGNIQ